tara:strand:- start:1179 stop:1499 length:321 start_codon:yes stop_codon:yes gene_type:complete
MAINTRAYDWSTNNFGLAEWDDISWAFSELSSNQFFDSNIADNFTPFDSGDDFSFSAVSAPSAPTLSGVAASTEPTFTSISIGDASYTGQTTSSPVFTELVILGEN